MTILFEPHRRDSQQFAVLLGSDVHTVATTADLAAMLRKNPAEMLAVLGPGVELDQALAVAAEYRVSRPAMGVVMLRDRLDVGLLGEAIRAGMREVVDANDSAGLLAACARSLEISRQMAPVNVRGGSDAGDTRPHLPRASPVVVALDPRGGRSLRARRGPDVEG